MMEKIQNFRLLTVHPNNDGKRIQPLIYRSAKVSRATPKDLLTLKKLGIRHIYDLRNPYETRRPSPINQDWLLVHHINVLEYTSGQFGSMMADLNGMKTFILHMYENILTESKEYGTFIRSILAQEKPGFLFHCSAGKDRTGIAAVILMHILNYPEDTIYHDYLQIEEQMIISLNESHKERMNRLEEFVDRESLEALTSVKPEFLDHYYRGIKTRFGSMDRYIADHLGISEEEKAALRNLYLE